MSEPLPQRSAYAAAIEQAAATTTPGLREAFATVPRERFLPAGPWHVIGPRDMRPQTTPDAEVHHVYTDVSIAIDPARHLYNGQLSFLARLIDSLRLRRGGRVLHVGAGLGYYSAVMASVAGDEGTVVAAEIDDDLAADARALLADRPQIDVRRSPIPRPGEQFDAILVNTGVTHPEPSWLDALAVGGRLVVPLTVALPAVPAPIGKGVCVLIERGTADRHAAEVLSFVMIYSAVGLRDAAMETKLGEALRRTSFPNLTRLRRDAHDRRDGCWLHGDGWCLSMEPA